jgi:hypothetical protein
MFHAHSFLLVDAARILARTGQNPPSGGHRVRELDYNFRRLTDSTW